MGYEQFLPIDRKMHGDDHPHVATSWDNLASVQEAKVE